MKNILSSLVIVFFLLIAVSFAQAATYYVQKTDSSDSNPCTQAQPCLTIARAATLATSGGDIVQVAPGTYAERVTLTRSGSAAGGKITFRGHDGSGCPTSVNSDPNSRGYRPNPSVLMKGFVIEASYIAIDCFRVYNDGSPVDGLEIRVANISHVDLQNNYIDGQGNIGTGIYLGDNQEYAKAPSNIHVFQNYITQTGYGFLMHCMNCLFEENEVYDLRQVAGSDGDYSRVMGDTITFRKNYFHGNTKENCVGCHIDCWQGFNVSGWDISNNITIDRNVCFNSHEGVIFTNSSQTTGHDNLTLTNNLIAYGPNDNHPWCILLDSFDHAYVYNNTCIDGGTVLARAGQLNFKNNIYVNGGGWPYSVKDGATLVASNNLLYESGRTYSSSSYPNDILSQDPLFVNAGSNNYHLQSTSPAINAGVNLSQLFTTDILGVARPTSTAWDIGAYQYAASAILYGDVSENGSVTAYDASLASQYAVGLITLTSIQITKADVSGNSSVSAYDASLIAQYAVGLITKFPVEP